MEFEGRARITHHLNIAPLIDVVLLLLIFFMLTSTFMATDVLDLELPSAQASRPEKDLDIVVLLDQNGQLAIDGEIVVLEEFETRLQKLLTDPKQQTVVLKTDAEESVQDMIDVMDAIRAAGAQRIFLAADDKAQN